MRAPVLGLSLIALVALSACQAPAPLSASRVATAVTARATSAYAQAIAPQDLSPALVEAARTPAQAASDEASRRRQIDFFAVSGQPVGLKVGSGSGAGHVLSFLGTSRQDADLNVELRALVAGSQFGVTMNYSGPTTLSRTAFPAPALTLGKPRRGADAPVSFELMMGLPGDGVTDAYGDYLGHLAGSLTQRYQARPFQFDDGPLVLAVHEGDDVTGFVFMNQGNRLVLGDRKYADVQNVAAYTTEGELAAAYTVIGFNRKTAAPAAAPVYEVERDARFGLFAVLGEL